MIVSSSPAFKQPLHHHGNVILLVCEGADDDDEDDDGDDDGDDEDDEDDDDEDDDGDDDDGDEDDEKNSIVDCLLIKEDLWKDSIEYFLRRTNSLLQQRFFFNYHCINIFN